VCRVAGLGVVARGAALGLEPVGGVGAVVCLPLLEGFVADEPGAMGTVVLVRRDGWLVGLVAWAAEPVFDLEPELPQAPRAEPAISSAARQASGRWGASVCMQITLHALWSGALHNVWTPCHSR
jgi:hypothetical protein